MYTMDTVPHLSMKQCTTLSATPLYLQTGYIHAWYEEFVCGCLKGVRSDMICCPQKQQWRTAFHSHQTIGNQEREKEGHSVCRCSLTGSLTVFQTVLSFACSNLPQLILLLSPV